jgi:mannose-6-phosphate isomerase
MKKIGLLKNSVQNYAWGSPTAIPELLGEPNPALEPRAELWMGAHPKAPSQVRCDGKWVSLIDLIEKHPHAILGKKVAQAYHNKLPYLFKVLAAAKPLSIQAHPSLDQAKAGFARETRQGIALDASNRNYKDDNHKPECICALSSLWAMCGLRSTAGILDLMGKHCPMSLAAELDQLKRQPDSGGLKRFFNDLMTMDSGRQKRVVAEAVKSVRHYSAKNPVVHWLTRLSAEYPSDIGILSPLLLNLIQLKPGQALYLPAGELHAYLEGVGMELMANSDNVLRGGLTPKHIDVAELIKVLNFEPRSVTVLAAIDQGKNERVYPTPADEFVLSMISVFPDSSYHSPPSRSVEIMLCTEGRAHLTDHDTRQAIPIKKGDSVIVPATVKGYSLVGNAVVFKAAVPERLDICD